MMGDAPSDILVLRPPRIRILEGLRNGRGRESRTRVLEYSSTQVPGFIPEVSSREDPRQKDGMHY